MSIGKVGKGEKIIVMMISEPLQDKFNHMDQSREELKWMLDEVDKLRKLGVEIPEEKYAALYRQKAKHEMLRLEFWSAVNEQYGLWHKENIGIRDGYCLVERKALPDPVEFMKELRKFVQERLGEDFEVGGGPVPGYLDE